MLTSTEIGIKIAEERLEEFGLTEAAARRVSNGISLLFIMPAAVRVFAEHQPVTSIVETLRALLAGQPAGSEIWTTLAWCLGLLAPAYGLAMRTHKRQGS
ncbi:hypothetical protein CDO73_10450 [Saccharibacillus sp. O23]|uniref:ABC transporter permease n=1 Tax=Saccharibacillus sp. O23 TaxID=2009338 RepID=UPI000B4E44E7|nr:ABC transporter permease [Saccharibacillus sp. O23]OWR30337.1 hypothetical protein CDO73_10450 [Saccharibacillus sp. O23]